MIKVMVLALTLNLAFGLSGCGTKASLGLTTILNDDDGIDEPLGVIRLNKGITEHTSIECEHISSAFTSEDVLTLDHCGVFYTF